MAEGIEMKYLCVLGRATSWTRQQTKSTVSSKALLLLEERQENLLGKDCNNTKQISSGAKGRS